MTPQDSPYSQTTGGQRYWPPHDPAQHLAPAPFSGRYPPPTNTMAILALVLAFSFWPLAIVCGHRARRQITRIGESGQGLATAGLVLSYLFLGLMVLVVITVSVLVGAAAPTDPLSTP